MLMLKHRPWGGRWCKRPRYNSQPLSLSRHVSCHVRWWEWADTGISPFCGRGAGAGGWQASSNMPLEGLEGQHTHSLAPPHTLWW